MVWTEEKLADLPSNNGFRLRGLEATRLDTFVDAAVAFATTMLVIYAGFFYFNLPVSMNLASYHMTRKVKRLRAKSSV